MPYRLIDLKAFVASLIESGRGILIKSDVLLLKPNPKSFVDHRRN